MRDPTDTMRDYNNSHSQSFLGVASLALLNQSMKNLQLPGWVKNIYNITLSLSAYSNNEIEDLRSKIARLTDPNPLVSVVIPAWNEEEGILHTIISLANSITAYPVELIVVDNNSTDGTPELLKALGVKTLLETKQGVGHSRTLGLHEAKGKYILTGDSDTLYPPTWIDSMTRALIEGENKPVYCVSGTYSFLPSQTTPRWQYSLYEMMSYLVIKKKEKTKPYLNVLGFNCGFVRAKGIEVDGYAIEKQRTFRGSAGVSEDNATEDGMMAYKLMEAGGFHAIKRIHSDEARVWTGDRRIQMDGGIAKALKMRVDKHLFSPVFRSVRSFAPNW